MCGDPGLSGLREGREGLRVMTQGVNREGLRERGELCDSSTVEENVVWVECEGVKGVSGVRVLMDRFVNNNVVDLAFPRKGIFESSDYVMSREGRVQERVKVRSGKGESQDRASMMRVLG